MLLLLFALNAVVLKEENRVLITKVGFIDVYIFRVVPM